METLIFEAGFSKVIFFFEIGVSCVSETRLRFLSDMLAARYVRKIPKDNDIRGFAFRGPETGVA